MQHARPHRRRSQNDADRETLVDLLWRCPCRVDEAGVLACPARRRSGASPAASIPAASLAITAAGLPRHSTRRAPASRRHGEVVDNAARGPTTRLGAARATGPPGRTACTGWLCRCRPNGRTGSPAASAHSLDGHVRAAHHLTALTAAWKTPLSISPSGGLFSLVCGDTQTTSARGRRDRQPWGRFAPDGGFDLGSGREFGFGTRHVESRSARRS